MELNITAAATIISVVWAIVQMVPAVRRWRNDARYSVVVDALEAGVQAAYERVTRPARLAGMGKLSEEIRKEAICEAMEVASDVASAHGVDLDKLYTPEELRAKLTEYLKDRKEAGIIGTSAGVK